MLSTLRRAFNVPDLRKRIIFTVLMVVIYRLGIHIAVPGIDKNVISSQASQAGSLLNFYDLMSGGALSHYSIFAMGVIPYINASIIMQLLNMVIPSLEQLSKEGDDGRKKIQKYTRYAALGIAVIMSYSQFAIMSNAGAISITNKFQIALIMITLTTASMFLMWLGDQITEYGIGNGVSLLIFINIISRFPTMIYQIQTVTTSGAQLLGDLVFAIVYLGLFLAVVITTLSERRIHVQYAGKTVGNKTFKGESTHIPINTNNSAVIAIIFALSVLQFPSIIAQFWQTSAWAKAITGSMYSPFNTKSWAYVIAYIILILFFTWFYTQVTFKPEEMAENMHKSSGFIPGIRPGVPTEQYLTKVLGRMSLIGGLFAAFIAVLPIVVGMTTRFNGIQFGGTSLLIEVGVALDAMRQLQSQLVMRHYNGFLK